MTKRVAHVLRKYDPDRWGGVETHVVALTAALRDRGWAPEVHAPAGPRAVDRALRAEVGLHRYRAHLPFLGSSARRHALREVGGNLVSFDELRALGLDPGLALAHVHTQNRIGGVVRSAMRWTKRPYVVSVHGPLLTAEEFIDGEDRRRRTGTLDLGQPFGALVGSRRVLEDAARVIVFNEDEARAMRERIGAKVVRMDQGVDARRLGSGRVGRALRRWPRFGGREFVLVLGRLGVQKNQRFALEVFARAAPRHMHIVFAGADTDPGTHAELEARATELGIAGRVHVLGNVPSEDVPDLLAACLVSMAPSRHEAFGLQVLESWAAGRPALFARTGGLADLASALPDRSCALPDLDRERWTRELGHLLHTPLRRHRHAAEGAALVRTRFDWDSVARRHGELYEEVLEASRAAQPPGGEERSARRSA